jgi:hypothetical protein
MINNQEVSIESTPEGISTITVGSSSVETNLPVSRSSSKVYVETSIGKKLIKILPDDAIKTSGIEDVKEITIIEEQGKAVYLISGTNNGKLFFIIPVSEDVAQEIDTGAGNVVLIKKPWWAFLAGI